LGLQVQGQNFQQKMAVDQALQQKKNDAFQQTIAQQQLAMQQQQQEFATSMGVQQSVFQQMNQRTGERWQTFQQDMQDLAQRRDKAKMDNRLDEARLLDEKIGSIQEQGDEVQSMMHQQGLFSAALGEGGIKVLVRYKDTLDPLITQRKNSDERINMKIKEGLGTAGARFKAEGQAKTASRSWGEWITEAGRQAGKMPQDIQQQVANPNEDQILKSVLGDVAQVLVPESGGISHPTVAGLLYTMFTGTKEAQQAAQKTLNASGITDDDIASIHQSLNTNASEQIRNLAADPKALNSDINTYMGKTYERVKGVDLSFLRKTNLAALDKDLAKVSQHIKANLPQLISMGLVDDREGIKTMLETLVARQVQESGQSMSPKLQGEIVDSLTGEVMSQSEPLRNEGLTPEDMDGLFKMKSENTLPEGEVGPQVQVRTGQRVNLGAKRRDLNRQEREAKKASGTKTMQREGQLDDEFYTTVSTKRKEIEKKNAEERALAEGLLTKNPWKK